MKLRDLVRDLKNISVIGDLDTEVSGLCHDSRLFQKGDLFFAIKGSQHDGHDFIPQAVTRGVSALIVENPKKVPGTFSGGVIVTTNPKELLGLIAAKFFENPSEKIFLAGVTGTNGKTTTTYMIEGLLECGVIGTINNHYKNNIQVSSHTTPDPISIQSLLKKWSDVGAKSVAMEVSSHAISQDRISNLNFDAAVFTNLTRDHLDFHKTFENYLEAKSFLFKKYLSQSVKKNKKAILNREDPYWEKMVPDDVPVWTFGISAGDLSVSKMKISLDGSDLELKTPLGNVSAHLQMVGRHNVANALGAIGVALHFGLDLKDVANKLSKISGVPGRLQRVEDNSKTGIRVFVDYAHTDDGLGQVLSFLNKTRDESSPNSKIITVFGCGGDRDKGKRPLMMKLASTYSDFVVVTSDNPRTEDPNKIIEDIIHGLSKSANFAVDADRRSAIQLAIGRAERGDIVLIAGKGHEDYQIIGTKKHPFDDVIVAKEALSQ